jgi:hypothetical protein
MNAVFICRAANKRTLVKTTNCVTSQGQNMSGTRYFRAGCKCPSRLILCFLAPT